MNSPLIQCPTCHSALLDGVFNLPEMVPCPACSKPLQVEVFPAFFRAVATGRDAEAVMVEGESGCFYHPQKKAVLPCEACGRFLCALCDCEVAGRHYCPACLEAGRTKGKIKTLQSNRTLYDSVALALALFPIISIIGLFLSVICAPIALFVAIRYWNTPLSIVPRSKARYIIASTLAVLEIVGWVLFFSLSFRNSHG